LSWNLFGKPAAAHMFGAQGKNLFLIVNTS